MRTCSSICEDQFQRQNLMYTTPISNMYQVSPPTLVNHNGFDDLLLAPHLRPTPSRTPTPSPPPLSDAPTKELDVAVTSTPARKRANRKDRHSKIVTAQGTRDRRVRLSLDVAKKFFDLQDMLGFDKASKTVDWLLTKSSKAIKAVSLHSTPKQRRCCTGIGKSESTSVSECEVNSTNNAGNIINYSTSVEEDKTPKEAQASLTTKRNSLIMKDSKRKARANTKERFKEKEIRRSATNIEDGDQSKQIVSLETTCEESETAYDMKSSTAVVGTNEYGVEFRANSSSLNLLQENWSMQCLFGGGGQEVNLGDYPFYERYWDEMNSLGIL